ncbi:transposase [Streptomyces sp. NPDC002172]
MLCNDLAWWQKAGVFDQFHRILLAELDAVGQLDWYRACVDGSHIRANRGRRHRSVAGRPAEDGQQTPSDLRLTRYATQGHHHCSERRRRHPDPRPGRRHPARRGQTYDSNPNRDELRKRRILPVISRKGCPNIKDMGKLRYVVEQTFALLHQFKRLAVRWERRTELHDAFVSLACSLICWRRRPTPAGVTRME